MAIAGKHSRLKVMSDASPIPFTNEATTANVARTEYSITDQSKRYWSRKDPVVVETSPNGSDWTLVESGYWVSHAGGKVQFQEAQPSGTVVRVSGAFVAVTTAVETREYSMTINNSLADVTVLEGPNGRSKLSTIVDASGTVSGFYNVNNLLVDKILEGKPLVIEMDVDMEDEDGDVWAVYALLNSHELSTAIESPITSAASWESDGEILVKKK